MLLLLGPLLLRRFDDLDIQQDTVLALRCNGRTSHLTNIRALVNRGIVSLFGTVPSEGDIALACCTVSGLKGVVRVINHLAVEDQS